MFSRVIAILLIAVGVSNATPGDVAFSYGTPSPCPSGLAFDGMNVWMADFKTDSLYAINPYSGEVTAAMLKDVGCDCVIVGHSERRHIFGETDENVNRKVSAALNAGLRPIVCVGETEKQREDGETEAVISRQVVDGLDGLTSERMTDVVIAYEPVWAIGTGKNATPEQAQVVHALIRGIIAREFDESTAEKLPILYGGSVKPANALELMSQEDIDGALVGGASLDADSFAGIVRAGVDASR